MSSRVALGKEYDWINHINPPYQHYYRPEEKFSMDFYSENHSKKDGVWRSGGEFRSMNEKISRTPGYLDIYRIGLGLAYAGGVTASTPNKPVPSLHDDGSSWGAEAINRTRPDRPVYPVGNALYELRDVPSMIKDIPNTFKRGFKSRLHKYGDTYIGTSFGWVPFISDLQGFATAHDQTIKRMDQLFKNGKSSVHRRLNLVDEVTESERIPVRGYDLIDQIFVTQCYHAPHEGMSFFEHRKKIWFSAKYSYDPMDPGMLRRSEWGNNPLFRRMEGISITPLNLYRAIPWTWLLDWFGNFADNLGNLQSDAFDYNIDYAYLMSHEEYNRVLEVDTRFYTSNDGQSQPVRAVTKTGHDYKSRVRASPFSLRLKTEGLSFFQAGVAGAFVAKYLGR